MNINPISHFRRLSDLMTRAQATDQNGNALSLEDAISTALDMILHNDRKIMVIGNGGSATIASHIHNDLCNSVGIPAMVFTDASQLTSLSNDYGYGTVFERPIDLWAKPVDLLWSISSSGKSENILKAVRMAKTKGCEIMTFSGFRSDNPLRQMGQINFYIPSDNYGEVEVSHLAFG